MGSSVVLILAFPLMFVEILFELITGAVLGYPTAQVELPYDEATGLVWEYDCVDDPYIKLVETKIEDGKQIFYFEGENNLSPDWNGEMMEIVFTDKNGNEEVYYSVGGGKRSAPSIYSSEECRLMEITMTANNPSNGGKWKVTEHSNYILYQEETAADTQTYTVVITPGNKKGSYVEYGMFSVKFAYVDSLGVPLELSTAIYKFKDGEHYLDEIKNESVSDYLDYLLNGIIEHSGA